MKTCVFCKGKVVLQKVTFDARVGEHLIIIKDVPAEVCLQCGERYFSPDVSRQIDDLMKAQPQAGETMIQVPVRTFGYTEQTEQ